MSRASARQPCNRLLEERWRESEHQQHRARLESIHAANAFAGRATAASLAPSGSSGSIHTSRSNASTQTTAAAAGATTHVRLVSRSQSPAAKSRQKRIDCENLILIKKIIALDNVNNNSKANSNTPTAKQHRNSKSTKLTHKKQLHSQSANRNTIVVPERASDRICKPPLPDVPPPSCHPLYTHHSTTTANNFADMNGSTLNFSKTYDHNRTQLRIQDENKRLLQRILSARKSYSCTQWSEQERERRKLWRNISRHRSEGPKHHASSTGRLPHYYGDGYDDDSEQVSTCGGRSLRRHNSSSDELISAGGLEIRLLPTTHLKPSQQQQQRLWPRSASAATGSRSLSTSWASAQSTARSPVPSSRKPAAESIVQRMRSMTIDKREYNDVDDGGDDQDQNQVDDDGYENGHDADEDDEGDVGALLQDLD